MHPHLKMITKIKLDWNLTEPCKTTKNRIVKLYFSSLFPLLSQQPNRCW
uniref:Uncharacterized protein n=1 Tax=Rhizophora mucronata TaxID=61149 RepID=A0A2P2PSR0_RHIMU